MLDWCYQRKSEAEAVQFIVNLISSCSVVPPILAVSAMLLTVLISKYILILSKGKCAPSVLSTLIS